MTLAKLSEKRKAFAGIERKIKRETLKNDVKVVSNPGS